MKRTLAFAALVGAALALQSEAAWARQAKSPLMPDRSATCLQLGSARIAGITDLRPTWRTDDGGISYCQVVGRLDQNGSFEVRMPASGWNGEFYMAGCGGMCGALETPDQVRIMRYGLSKGYAVATSDGGHTGANVFDATFAVGNPAARKAFAYGAVHAAVQASKAVLASYYSTPARRSVFEGCSTGGRQGLIEAERYPNDFDGIVVGSPAFDTIGLSTYWTWISQTDADGRGGWKFPPAKVEILRQAVLSACGDAEGVVEEPRACRFSAEALLCKANSNPATCLTADELAIARRWYAGPRGRDGGGLYTDGAPLGSEPFWIRPGMPPIFGSVFNFQKAAADLGLRYLLIDPAPGAAFKINEFDVERDRAKLGAMDALMTPKPDLSRFKARGGRLIIYQGWADPVTPPLRTAAYYRTVERRLGGRAAADGVLKLFMLPGLNHCGGPGALPSAGLDMRSLSPMPVLEQWLDGTPPSVLRITSFDAAGSAKWGRGICAFPAITVYKGKGDRRTPEAWACEKASE